MMNRCRLNRMTMAAVVVVMCISLWIFCQPSSECAPSAYGGFTETGEPIATIFLGLKPIDHFRPAAMKSRPVRRDGPCGEYNGGYQHNSLYACNDVCICKEYACTSY